MLVLVFLIFTAFFLYKKYNKKLTDRGTSLNIPSPEKEIEKIFPENADKQFKFVLNSYPPFQDDVLRINPSDPDNEVLSNAEVLGLIQSEPIIDGEKNFKLSVKFFNKNLEGLDTNIFLGKDDNDILVLFADKGYIDNKQEWRTRKVSEIVKFLRKNDPVLVRFYLEIHNDFESSASCDANCINFFSETKKHLSENLLLTQVLKGEKEIESKIEVGPVIAIIIYSN